MRARIAAALAGLSVLATPAWAAEVSARLGTKPIPTAISAARRDVLLDKLVAAYPAFLSGQQGDVLVWRDGTRTPVSDGRGAKTPAQIVGSPDIEDIFAWPYPLAGAPIVTPTGDPGRARPAALFQRMYGDCHAGQVRPNLVPVRWVDGGTLMFTRVNGASEALAAVVRDLAALGPGYARYLSPSAGTYNCRAIAGTALASMHAYGAAIDLNTKYSAYWEWADQARHGLAPYTNQIPRAVIAAFERHGFIWGGRWADFDTMHFEYRPELIAVARAGG